MARSKSDASGRRKRPPRELRERFLIVTEGEVTEPEYVEGLDNYLRSKDVSVVVRCFGVGKDPVKVVRECMRLRQKASDKGIESRYDQCFVLIDVDEHTNIPEACELASAESIQVLISNIKFEVWLRWHTTDSTATLSGRQLDQALEKQDVLTKKHLAESFPFDKVDQAVAVARRADPDLASGRQGPNPSSAMPILVEILQN